jgi:hypothetical protein
MLTAIFRLKMPQIEQIYCDYCKRQEGAILRLQELEAKPDVQAFFRVGI